MSFKVTKTEPRGSAKAKKIASSISFVDATGSVTYTDAAGTVSHVDLSSTVEYTYVASAVSSRYISPSAITLGYYLLKHEAFDAMAVADVANFTYAKNLFDEIAVAGDKTIFYNMKAPSDIASVSTVLDLGLQKRISPDFAQITDEVSYQVDFNRLFVEQGQYGDVITFATTKLESEVINVTDSSAKSTATTKADTFSVTDITLVNTNKNFENAYTVADSQLVTTNKNSSEVLTLVDSAPIFALGVSLSDLINVTDDFLGASNVDDDQTMHFGKTLINNGDVSDSLSRSVAYNRVFGDLFSTDDSIFLAPEKRLYEAASFVDVFSRDVQFSRSLSDTTQILESAVIATTKELQEVGTATESAVKSTTSLNTDSASFTDSGLVFWQGYVEDPTYFAEDYVGNSQTF